MRQSSLSKQRSSFQKDDKNEQNELIQEQQVKELGKQQSSLNEQVQLQKKKSKSYKKSTQSIKLKSKIKKFQLGQSRGSNAILDKAQSNRLDNQQFEETFGISTSQVMADAQGENNSYKKLLKQPVEYQDSSAVASRLLTVKLSEQQQSISRKKEKLMTKFSEQKKMQQNNNQSFQLGATNYKMGTVMIQSTEAEVTFNNKQFLVYFIYHLFYYFIFGPLSILIIRPIAGKYLATNMGFWGFSWFILQQTIQWFLITLSLGLFILDGYGKLSNVEIYMMISGVILRSLVIASRYGTISSQQLNDLKSNYYTYEELSLDFALYKWREHGEDIISKEIESSITRNEVDKALFFFEFITEVSQESGNKLRKLQNDNGNNNSSANVNTRAQEFIKKLTEKMLNSQSSVQLQSERRDSQVNLPFLKIKSLQQQQQQQQKVKKMQSNVGAMSSDEEEDDDESEDNIEDTMFFGFNLGKELVLKGSIFLQKNNVRQAFIYGIIHASLPSVVRVLSGQGVLGSSMTQIINALTMFLINTYLFTLNFSFVVMALNQLKLKVAMMAQLSQVLAARKVDGFTMEKSFPTINIFDPISLRTWGNLRKILFDYGKKYYMRAGYNTAIFLMFYLMIFMLTAFQYFQFSNFFDDSPFFYAVFTFEVFLVLLYIINYIIQASSINRHFQIHKAILKQNKTVVCDMIYLQDIYFKAEGFVPENYIYTEGVRRLKAALTFGDFEDILPEHLVNVKDVIEDLMEELDLSEYNESIRIIGFICSPALVTQIFAGLFTLLFAVIQQYVANSGDDTQN